jgi:predicted transposase/invertase (TIGR01784 family)
MAIKVHGEECYEQGLKKGLEIAQEEGKQKVSREIALNLKELGLSPEYIQKATGLSMEEVVSI